MLKIENGITPYPEQWMSVIRGARNPMNSWDKIDSKIENGEFIMGEKDLDLLKRLSKSGDDHGKFLRMLPVIVDVTGPLYWWKEADTYKVGTVANSCSTMHKIMAKEFTESDFSLERAKDMIEESYLCDLFDELNELRDYYLRYDEDSEEMKKIREELETHGKTKKDIWYTLIQLLPSSYNQRRTLSLNYATLKNMYRARLGHKLDEWKVFCDWCETLPYFMEICGR